MIKPQKFILPALVFVLFCSVAFSLFILVMIVRMPRLSSLEDYNPSIVTRMVSRDGKLIGEYYTERRYLLKMEEMPELVVKAFTSAEDDRFFEHSGVDFNGILRATFANFRAGRVVQGGSTITQQVAKSLLLTPERSFQRKFKEVMLAYKIETSFTKQQILYLYLNQIYLGQGAYGVEAAARSYFHKSANDLTAAEAALLAGLVQAPSKYAPTKNPRRARERQLYVLRRMHDTNVLSSSEYKKAVAEDVKIYHEEDINPKIAPYYLEHARQYVQQKYGQEALYSGGLTVELAADSVLSETAMKAVRANLRDLDKRQGYRGPLQRITAGEAMLEELKKIRMEVVQKKLGYNLLPTTEVSAEELTDVKWADYTLRRAKELDKWDDERTLLTPGEAVRGIVTKIEPDDKSALVMIGAIKARLAIKDMRWAKRIKPPDVSGMAQISRVSESLHQGDVILVAPLEIPSAAGAEVPVALEQEPIAQGALLSMEAATGHVLAMVGGYDYAKSEYNRALQGERQPGSAFKAFLYAAALDKGFTPASIIVDNPIIFESQNQEGGGSLKWIPENNSEKFYGDTTMRTAVINSRNVPAVKVLQEILPSYFVQYLRNLGVTGPLSADLSLALGSKGMTLLELTKLYALFPRMGMRIEPVFVLKVLDHSGKPLEQYDPAEAQREAAARWTKFNEENHPQQESEPAAAPADPADPQQQRKNTNRPPTFPDPLRALDERTAYVMTHLLQEVVLYGTGTNARVLKRKVGGKTGTTNEFVDAWFMGFSPELITGSWTGFDNPRTLGPGEVGSRAAMPAWIQYMETALSVYKADEYPVPKGIVFVRMDPKTGLLAGPGNTAAVKEAFIEGTEPTQNRANQQSPDSSDFFREDF